jgi:predicted HicB family RNase H-like nuclease
MGNVPQNQSLDSPPVPLLATNKSALKTLSIRLPRGLHSLVKAKAALQDKDMTEYVMALLETSVADVAEQ